MTFANWVDGIVIPLVNTAVMPLLYGLALLFFVFGMFRTFFAMSDEKREEGKKFAVWGIIALVVIFSVWSIVSLLLNTFFGGVGATSSSSSFSNASSFSSPAPSGPLCGGTQCASSAVCCSSGPNADPRDTFMLCVSASQCAAMSGVVVAS